MFWLLRQVGARIVEIGKAENIIMVVARMERDSGICPSCSFSSSRIHSRYERRLLDLACEGRSVVIRLNVRRFFCVNPDCQVGIFTERIPELVNPGSRRTLRLNDLVTNVGVQLGGEPSVRVLRKLGIPVSADTVLRLILSLEPESQPETRIIGVDDWAWCKGRRYGAILVDLEQHKPIDILPDATAATLEEWLKQHPKIEVVSRDRAGSFADGARKGAAQAIQVADRWHLLKNIGDALERYLQSISLNITVNRQITAPDIQRSLPAQNESKQQASRQRRVDRYTEVKQLVSAGTSLREISRLTGMSRQTVQRFADSESFPEQSPRPRPSNLDEFKDYIACRWSEGCQNGTQLYRELNAMGYKGCQSSVGHYVVRLRPLSRRNKACAQPGMSEAKQIQRKSPREVARLLLKPADQLTLNEQTYIDALISQTPKLCETHNLAQSYIEVFRERRPALLDQWLELTECSGINALKGLAKGIRRDRDAVIAALNLPWSNGQVEGQINRLKALKRQMYGRAGIRLLRARFLLS